MALLDLLRYALFVARAGVERVPFAHGAIRRPVGHAIDCICSSIHRGVQMQLRRLTYGFSCELNALFSMRFGQSRIA